MATGDNGGCHGVGYGGSTACMQGEMAGSVVEISMTGTSACAFGFLGASLVPPAVIALTAPVSGEVSVGLAVMTFLFILPQSIAAVIVLGLPTFLVLRRYAPWRWWWVLIVGFLLGLPVAIAIYLPAAPALRSCLYYGLIGAASAVTFWLIWWRLRTATDAPPQDARPQNASNASGDAPSHS
ncbi:MAG: hypothetical protein WD711_04100 [Dongiaceae bacterium]